MTQISSIFNANELIAKITKKEGFEGEPPTLTDIQEMAIATPEPMSDVAIASTGATYKVITAAKGVIRTSGGIASKSREIIGDTVSDWDTLPSLNFVDRRDLATVLSCISRHIIRTAGEPSIDQVEWLHTLWALERQEVSCEIEHPLRSVVRAWIIIHTAKHITSEHDYLHPAAIIKNPMGSVREINFTDSGGAQLREFASPERISQVNPDQMRLGFNDEPPSILPDIMPLEVPNPEGVKPTTKGGAVSHVVRIFYEALMALEPHERASDIAFRLGDLIDYLNPDGKFHRANQLPYIIDALEILHIHATLPWIDDTGEMRKWRPVWVKTPLSMDSKNDAPVHMRVEVPPDARQGYMILKHTHRLLGKKSGPQFNAYHTISWLWDKHATVKGNLIDPTRPIDRRNEKGEIVGADGKPILTARGKPITNLYHDRVIAQGDREDNPAADRYPVLSKNDLIAACMPKATDTSHGERWRRTKAYWKGLEKMGIIRIKRERTGWRIFPSQEHLAAHRGVRASAQKKV